MRFGKLLGAAVAASVLSVVSVAHAGPMGHVLTFDGTYSGSGAYTEAVDGYTFTVSGSGFQIGTASDLFVTLADSDATKVLAFQSVDNPLTISVAGTGLTLDGVEFEGGFTPFTVDYYLGSSKLGTATSDSNGNVAISTTFDRLEINADSGTSDLLLFDNVQFQFVDTGSTGPTGGNLSTDAVPLPAAAMSGSALLALSALRRRR